MHCLLQRRFVSFFECLKLVDFSFLCYKRYLHGDGACGEGNVILEFFSVISVDSLSLWLFNVSHALRYWKIVSLTVVKHCICLCISMNLGLLSFVSVSCNVSDFLILAATCFFRISSSSVIERFYILLLLLVLLRGCLRFVLLQRNKFVLLFYFVPFVEQQYWMCVLNLVLDLLIKLLPK